MDNMTTLDRVKVGKRFIVQGYIKRTALTDRLNDLGLTVNTAGTVLYVAPPGGTVCINFRGYSLSVKRRDLKNVCVKVVR